MAQLLFQILLAGVEHHVPGPAGRGLEGDSCIVTPCYISTFLKTLNQQPDQQYNTRSCEQGNKIVTTMMRHQGQADRGMNCSTPRRNHDEKVHVLTCKSLMNSCKIIVYMWEGWAEKRSNQTHQRPSIGLLALGI